jgi:hypothetical protein
MKKEEAVKLTVAIPQADYRMIVACAKNKGISIEDYLIDMAIKDIILSSTSLAESQSSRQGRACKAVKYTSKG